MNQDQFEEAVIVGVLPLDEAGVSVNKPPPPAISSKPSGGFLAILRRLLGMGH